MEPLIKNNSLSNVWMYRLVRLAFGAFFIAIAIIYKDAWVAYIFGGLFIFTTFFKPVGCIGGDCGVNKK